MELEIRNLQDLKKCLKTLKKRRKATQPDVSGFKGLPSMSTLVSVGSAIWDQSAIYAYEEAIKAVQALIDHQASNKEKEKNHAP